ncbi:MAG: hypothetical protein EOM53_02560 [Alphaproteobacteria bacterium]|nr:hypothetical protein [Alphaproteobacteria bacterium]
MKKSFFFILGLSLFLTTLQLPSILTYTEIGTPSLYWKRFLQEALAGTFCLFGFLYLSNFYKLSRRIIWPLLITGCVTYAYFSHFFKYYLDLEMLSLVMGGTQTEFFSMFPYTATLLGLFLSALILFIQERKAFVLPLKKLWIGISFLLILICFVSRKVGSSTVPMNLLHSAKLYAFLQTPDRKALPPAHTKEVFPNNRVFGLIRLESMTGTKHFPNGYRRNNMPLVNGIKNIVNFPNFYALGQRTSVATPFMFTRAGEEHPERSKNEQSFIKFFRDLGWQTLFESPSEANFSKPFRFYNTIAEEAEEHSYVLEDEDVPPFYNSYMEKQTKPLFLSIGFNSVHRPFGRRPKTEVYYTPDCYAQNLDELLACSFEAMNNAYDNEVRFIDRLLAKIIGYTTKKEALLFFVSDHGEMLNDEGFHRPVKGDRAKCKSLRNVVAFAWASDSWRAKYPQKWANLQKNAPYYMNAEVLFHSALECNNIESDSVDKTKSVCSPTFKENTIFKKRYENAGDIDPIKEGINLIF